MYANTYVQTSDINAYVLPCVKLHSNTEQKKIPNVYVLQNSATVHDSNMTSFA